MHSSSHHHLIANAAGMLAHFKATSTVVAEPVSPADFCEFGGVISSSHQLATVSSSSANYGTAVKLSRVSPVVNADPAAQANLNLFRCSPPEHLIDDHQHADGGLTYTCKVLERHPTSTQTFVPMGRRADEVAYMVIVAPPDPSSPQKLPLLEKIRAFVVMGDQAITYGQGIWHAPMIALGEVTDFAVLIHETGIASKDTEEVSLDTVTVEFTTSPFPAQNKNENPRTAQSESDFAKQKEQYHQNGPPVVSVQAAVGDERFDVKQIKYAVEREYYRQNYRTAIDLVDNNPVANSKLQRELSTIKERAQRKLEGLTISES